MLTRNLGTNITKLKFKNNHIVYENFIKCTVKDYEFNLSYNPTLLSGSQGLLTPFSGSVGGDIFYINSGSNYGILKDMFTGSISGSEFSPYVTMVGLYNDANDLLAVGKMAAPMPLSSNTDVTFLIKWDTQWSPRPYFTPSVTPTATPTTTPSITPTPSVTPSTTPSISITPSVTPSVSISPSTTPSISITPSVTPSVSISPSATPSMTPSPTRTPSVTPTSSAIDCRIQVSFDVDIAGNVSYVSCCGTTQSDFYGIGPQVITDCLRFGTVAGTTATISGISYSVTNCSCTPPPSPSPSPSPASAICYTSVTFDVDAPGNVGYIDCCGVPQSVSLGGGPQVINGCIEFGTVNGLTATISNITYNFVNCTC